MMRPVRVVFWAAALSALSFAAGVAGDLSAPAPAAGARVVVRIPPERSEPGRLISTASADARVVVSTLQRRPTLSASTEPLLRARRFEAAPAPTVRFVPADMATPIKPDLGLAPL